MRMLIAAVVGLLIGFDGDAVLGQDKKTPDKLTFKARQLAVQQLGGELPLHDARSTAHRWGRFGRDILAISSLSSAATASTCCGSGAVSSIPLSQAALGIRRVGVGAQEDRCAEHAFEGCNQPAVLLATRGHAGTLRHLGGSSEPDDLTLLLNSESRQEDRHQGFWPNGTPISG